MLNNIITSKTRLQLLVKFFISAANSGYLRGLAIEMNENTNAIRKELNNLSEAGYILREDIKSKIMYRANNQHPLFSLLQQIVKKHLGIDQIVAQIVERMGDVTQIVLIGDYAKGIDSGCIEIIVIGNNLNQEYIKQLLPKIEKEINKKIKCQLLEEYQGKGIIVFDAK